MERACTGLPYRCSFNKAWNFEVAGRKGYEQSTCGRRLRRTASISLTETNLSLIAYLFVNATLRKMNTRYLFNLLCIKRARVVKTVCASGEIEGGKFSFVKLILQERFLKTNLNMYTCFNLLKTKRNLLYVRNQSVPRSKHFPPWL